MHKLYTDKQLTRVIKLLDDGKWHYSPQIVAVARIVPSTLRSMNNQTGLFVTGHSGYKLAAYATQEEYEATIHHLESRIEGLMNHLASLGAHWNELE